MGAGNGKAVACCIHLTYRSCHGAVGGDRLGGARLAIVIDRSYYDDDHAQT